ncbi:MAG TPA: potassium-transporting ATPase subunit C [Gemmataceae bacterium]|jgi:K+-transporting ATPase ATPase C chain
MTSHLRSNLILVALTLILCSVLYPLVLLGVGQVVFHDSANGSLVEVGGKPIGSRLIAQNFTADRYFWPRPSAAVYNAAASGASNWGANNPKLRFRVARQLGPIVKYTDGKPVGPDVEVWFAEKDRLAAWATDNPTLAAEWVKTDDTTKKLVADYAQANPDVLEAWRKDNADGDVPNVEESPDAVAVQFFASFAARHARVFPGKDVAGVFFDAWLQEHRDAKLEPVPADMVTASGSGLDPHITLRNARYQLDRVATARSATEADRPRVRQQVQAIVQAAASRPLAGLAGGDALVNVLDVNLRLDRELPAR